MTPRASGGPVPAGAGLAPDVAASPSPGAISRPDRAAGAPSGPGRRTDGAARSGTGGLASLRWIRVLGPSLAAGVALALSLPPWGWWPLAFVGAGILYWRLRGLRARTRFLAGWFAGLGCYVIGLEWTGAFSWYGATILIAVEALSMAVAASMVPARRGRLPVFVGAFTLLEALRFSWPFGGLPLGGVFLGQAEGPLLPVARLGGPLLLTLVVWAGGGGAAAIVMAFAQRWRRDRSDVDTRGAGTTRQWRSAGIGLAAIALVVALGVGASVAPDGGPPIGSVTVASVQGGGKRGDSNRDIPPAKVFRAQLAATHSMERQVVGHPPRLVLWPEDVVAVDHSLTGTPEAADLSSIASALGATVVAGVTVTVSSSHFLNEAVAWGPSGREVGRYEKVHRVPFGEYVPYRSFFAHFANLSAVPRNAVPGHGSGLLPTPAAKLGVMISYEVFFADRGRSSVRAGAQLLVVPTNTSSYATSQVPSQEVAADRVQAVEEGRDLVQAAPTGYSTVVRSNGTVVERSVLNARQVLLGTVALRSGSTIYERFGSLPVLVLAALLVLGGWATDRLRRAGDQRS